MRFGPKRDTDSAPMDVAGQGDDSNAAQLTTAQTATSTRTNHEYPTGLRLALVLGSAYVSVFLVSLDRLIVTTAIPKITDEFHSLPDVGWYGSAYLLTSAAFQLLFGKLLSFFPIRVVFGSAVFLFEVGSAICGAAPTSVAFILGRAVQGVGSAGIFSGAISIIVYAVPLERRALFQGLFGAVFGISSILGPLVGGAFTSNPHLTWRWCFYINLPFGFAALAFILVFLRIPDRPETKQPFMKKILQLDIPGTAALLPAVVSLLLALQWGGLTYPWSNARIIALLTLAGVLLVAFVAIQVLLPKTATIPPRIFKQRSILAGFWSTLLNGSQMMIFVYYLPIWFQAIKGVSPVDSGIRLLPTTLAIVVASIFNGLLVNKIGYYTPSMIAGAAIIAVGAGLLTTLRVDTPAGQWIGYQIIYGVGQGLTFQAPNLAAQTVLPKKDVPIGASLMFFTQILGGGIFISVAENVLDGELVRRFSSFPGFSKAAIEEGGATSLLAALPDELREQGLEAYNESLRVVLRIGLILASLSILGALAMEWRSIKAQPEPEPDAADAERGEGAEKRHKTDEDVESRDEALEGASAHQTDEKRGSLSTEAPDDVPHLNQGKA